jgi:hypothetical protein
MLKVMISKIVAVLYVLCECRTFLILRGEYKFQVSVNKRPRKIFGFKKHDVIEQSVVLQKAKVHELYRAVGIVTQ